MTRVHIGRSIPSIFPFLILYQPMSLELGAQATKASFFSVAAQLMEDEPLLME